MNRLKSFVFAGFLLATDAFLHAAEVENSTKTVPIERMQQVYDEVKTPFKYGVVIRGEANELVDSPSETGDLPACMGEARLALGRDHRELQIQDTLM